MVTGKILIERQHDIATVVIDNESKRNALSREMWIQLAKAFRDLGDEPNLRCIVLRGKGTEAFGSGGDIAEYLKLRSESKQAMEFSKESYGTMDAVRDCPVPTIAAIEGVCVGGAFQLAGLCDLRICTNDSRFGLPLTKLGVTVTHFELAGILRFAGYSVATELLLEGRVFDAAEAYDKGLVNRVVAKTEFAEELRKMVERVVSAAPLAARLHKKFLNRLMSAAPLLDTEIIEGYECFDTEDYRIGCRSFLDKTKPEFVGR